MEYESIRKQRAIHTNVWSEWDENEKDINEVNFL